MQLVIEESYDAISGRLADDLVSHMGKLTSPLLCVASGDSPKGAYSRLVEKKRHGLLDIGPWYFLALDEWIGLGKDDPGSCRYVLDQQLFIPLGVPEERIFYFDGKTTDSHAECRRAESYIREQGGIEWAILGLGMNGHIGLNEPGTPAGIRSHVSEIQPQTQQVGQKYFSRPQALTQGITLGLGTIREAKNLALVVSGIQKAAIVQVVLEGGVNSNVPGSLLMNHPSLRVYLDQASASRLKGRKNP